MRRWCWMSCMYWSAIILLNLIFKHKQANGKLNERKIAIKWQVIIIAKKIRSIYHLIGYVLKFEGRLVNLNNNLLAPDYWRSLKHSYSRLQSIRNQIRYFASIQMHVRQRLLCKYRCFIVFTSECKSVFRCYAAAIHI